ncbi:uncharacterized protein LOC127751003 [Frankliniella occidentalis]|uniref:Uncharacterized protein LOC127751003 n=1 Tax=Frankliniella occidentalis TaxID=133901 RepID=A0A9C6X674_FRAOC|nr:uncharacterized protein LOC127751003 [Frankliniella occidentalis]
MQYKCILGAVHLQFSLPFLHVLEDYGASDSSNPGSPSSHQLDWSPALSPLRRSLARSPSFTHTEQPELWSKGLTPSAAASMQGMITQHQVASGIKEAKRTGGKEITANSKVPWMFSSVLWQQVWTWRSGPSYY